MLGFIEKNQNLSRKDRERLLKKHEILSAATKLFADHGFEKTTLDEIAEVAEFGKGTIYNYFKNKEEIYRDILINTISNYDQLLKEIDKSENTFIGFIKSLVMEMFQFCKKDQDTFNLFVRMRTDYSASECIVKTGELKQFTDTSFEIFNRRIQLAIKEKEIINVETMQFMNLFRSMIFPYIHFMLLHSKGEINYKKEAKFVLKILFNGILTKNKGE